ncbi:MAG: esterase-like activity of phytase family protein, partial [Bdellovibrionales bacterium]|nr:esterase-like activity of phytase family protein [Bdellovibrionales bacterium]
MQSLTRFIFICALLTNSSLYATDTLRFIGDINFPTGEKFQETEIGGLSGITYDQAQNKFLAISDDRSQVNEARFYEFDVTLTDKDFKVTPSKVVRLKNQKGTYFTKGSVDFEGISIHGKDVLISSEGGINREFPIAPALYSFSRDGSFKEQLSVPEKFLLPKKEHTDKMYGSRDNKSFEALSTSLDGKTTYMGSEEALFQDGPISTIEAGSTVRIILYKDLKPVGEIGYQLEKVEAIKGGDLSTPAENGLVDIAAIDDKTFYAMERSYLPYQNKNVIRIFKCQITSNTTDLSKMDGIKSQSFGRVEKTLVADL